MTAETKLAPGQGLASPGGLARTGLQLFAFGLLMTAVCWASIVVPRLTGRGEGIWLANAVTLSFLLTLPRRRWLAWLAAAGAGNVLAGALTGEQLGLSALMSGCNLIEIAGSAFVLRLLVREEIDLSRTDHLLRFTLVAGVGAPLVSASLAAWALGGLRGDSPWFTFGTWVAADGLGAVILTPLLLTLRHQPRRLAATPLTPQAWLALAALAGATAVVFSVRQPIGFVIPPALLLVVFQLETLGAAWGVLIILVIAVVFTALGLGPMADPHRSVSDAILTAQLFLAAITLTSLPTAAALSQRRRLQAEVAGNAAQTAELYRRAKLAEEVGGVGYWRFEVASRKLAWAESLAATFGMDPTETPIIDLVTARLHPEDREGVSNLIAEAAASAEPISHQFKVVRPDGEVRHLLGRTVAERGDKGAATAIFGATIDITELKRAEAEMAASEERYRLVMEASRDIVLKYERDGTIVFASQGARLFGYEPADLVGRHGFDLVHPEDRDAAIQRMADLFEDPEASRAKNLSEMRVRLADGSYIWVEGNPSVIRNEAGEAIAYTNCLRDITKRKAMETELRAAREAAEAAAVVKGDFLANMSHELRTPLTSVLGFTRLALDQPDLNEVSRGYILKASNAGGALLSTVNDILDFSKLESGQLQIRLEPTDASGVCRETLDLFSEAAALKGVSLRFEPGQIPDRLALDPNRLRQLLLNLIGNAVKFSDEGEIRISADWCVEDQRLRVSVTDQGPGIAAEQQSLLFRRFSQVDGSSTRRHGGTGLGLAICLGLVEAMGGEIGMESQLGEGARFFFEIPASVAMADEAEDADEINLFPVGVRVLVTDDHPANRELVRAVLAPFGAEITEAGDGAEAVAVAAKTVFDLILMDLRMPVLDGEGAMKAIRVGDGPNRATPILAFSAGADAPGAAARLAAGFNGDLAKPVLPADLIMAVCAYAASEAQGGDSQGQDAPETVAMASGPTAPASFG